MTNERITNVGRQLARYEGLYQHYRQMETQLTKLEGEESQVTSVYFRTAGNEVAELKLLPEDGSKVLEILRHSLRGQLDLAEHRLDRIEKFFEEERIEA